ncbi:SMI1/KNR4 family protein [Glaesserella parasuis]|uniref:SMI1/KNR4 family protein n=1 Tax=Glaesserella parasuis TaxID=738 RepID=A0A084EXC5_GLAPU|nr:SMI1/KNR4 family protein [Glaesserella parasuis]KEZ22617.1 hypothetical protein HS327_01073 [Glaesserella parasuis]MCT8574901.1 SMI1/KNR4 family protein [Glaesserella parasuis]MDD2167332.1 SMI1/KNR4 family protein [Glaesserella parasuis]MDD2172936.1 SMI1/KNR4 family protein [Glaesserella parasuis]MDG6346460.1 SMI1/KNR4 family protein [Glaesserella parasuis]
MRNTFRVYSPYALDGFIYPSKYLELSNDLTEISKIPFFSWWFEDCDDSELEIYTQALEHFTGIKNLISFARDGDWAACFNLLDRSGDPKVYVYDLGNRNNHYEVKNFEEWLKLVISEAQK